GADTGRDIVLGARRRPIDVALLEAGGDCDDVGRELRPAGCAARHRVGETHVVETGHRLRSARRSAAAMSAVIWLCARRNEAASGVVTAKLRTIGAAFAPRS